MEITSSRRWRAAVRVWEAFVGGGGRVRAWACLAFMRSRRELERFRGDSLFAFVVVVEDSSVFNDDGVVGKVVFFDAVDSFFCVMAAFRSSSLRCPFAKVGEILSRERQAFMGSKGRFDMNVVIVLDVESGSVSWLKEDSV